MTLEVVIHAGASKCGSSTNKHFLYSNATALHEAGVALVSSDDFTLRPGNRGVHLGSNPALDDFARAGTPRAEMRRNLLASIEACETAGRRMALILAENALPTAPEHAERYPLFFADVIANFSVRLAAYVRRPDEWLV